MSDSVPKYLYHYTTKESAASIKATGFRESTDTARDASLGPGVYFTAKKPQTSDKALLKNNYDGAAPTQKAKVESYVRVETAGMQTSELKRASGGRNVYCAPAAAVDMSKANPVVGDRSRFGK
eukprot:TRINITY_DN37311_c0_g1_i1.p1 TRINITY_DN37311_c0_g1~~TRINITY_DN37311_c0_g1_i1.p1  ORF type:complete len:123 (+),score=23.32 TRINITY_DN37311_c0_g1_i1:81-449(+)